MNLQYPSIVNFPPESIYAKIPPPLSAEQLINKQVPDIISYARFQVSINNPPPPLLSPKAVQFSNKISINSKIEFYVDNDTSIPPPVF